MSDVGDGELSDLALINFSTTELVDKSISVDVEPVRNPFKIQRPGEWVFEFLLVVHQSIFPKVKKLWHGKLRIMFNNSLKILF